MSANLLTVKLGGKREIILANYKCEASVLRANIFIARHAYNLFRLAVETMSAPKIVLSGKVSTLERYYELHPR